MGRERERERWEIGEREKMGERNERKRGEREKEREGGKGKRGRVICSSLQGSLQGIVP